MKVFVLSLFLLASLSFAQHTMNMNQPKTMTMSAGSLDTLEGEAFETAFISGMIAHHQGAIEMANWILERSQLPGIISSANQIIAAQEPEIKLMQSWLDEWYGGKTDNEATQMMQADMQMMMTAMNSNENADRAFLAEMSLHHNSAIDMAQLALLKATHPKLRELAKNIIRNQAEEIAGYQEMLEALAR